MYRPYLWTYWEGEKPYYIEQCLRSFYIHNSSWFTIKILTEKEIDNSLMLNINFKKLPISQKVDCLRIALLYQFGGMWIDADTLIIKPLIDIYRMLGNNDFLGIKWDTGKVSNGYIAMQKGSKLGKELLEITNKKIKNVTDNKLELIRGYPWVYFGEETFKNILPKYKCRYLSRKTFVPINFPFAENCDMFFESGNIQDYIEKNTKAIALNYSCFKKSHNENYKNPKQGTLLSSIIDLGEKIERASKKIQRYA